jgi:hypothetical protein
MGMGDGQYLFFRWSACVWASVCSGHGGQGANTVAIFRVAGASGLGLVPAWTLFANLLPPALLLLRASAQPKTDIWWEL